MKKKIILVFSSLIIIALALGYFYLYPQGLHTFKLKQIHNILYEVYFPEDRLLTNSQKIKRLFYKNLMWIKIKSNPLCEKMLNPLLEFKANLPLKLQEDFKDVITNGIQNASIERIEDFQKELMKQAPLEVQQQILSARQTWTYLIYSIPLVNEIANLTLDPEPMGMDIPLEIPKSRLYIDQSEIKHENGEIDYLIIGSGPSGSVIAHELTRSKKARIVLVESGSFVKPLCQNTEFKSELMESHNNRRTLSGGIILRNAHVIGGGTTVNLDLAFSPLLPQIQKKLQSWIDEGHLPPQFFHDKENDWIKLKNAYEWVTKHLHTRQVNRAEVNENNHLLLDGTSLARTYDLNARKPEKVKKILKISSVETFLLPALQQNGEFKGDLSLISDAHVSQVEFENIGMLKKAKAVQITFSEPYQNKCVVKDPSKLKAKTEKSYTIKAKNIILCAGALGSAEILLRSKLKNDHIGQGVILHPSMGIVGIFNKEIDALKGLSASVYAPAPDGSYFFEAMSAEPNFIAAIHPGNGHDILDVIRHFKNLGGFGIMVVDSVSMNNHVFLNPDSNKIDVAYVLNDVDKRKMKQGLLEAIKILLKEGAKSVFVPTSEMIYPNDRFSPIKSEIEAKQIINRLEFRDGFNFISSVHMQGTNKINKDPQKGVISPHFRVWDPNSRQEISNFYICDSSIFPSSVGANPMQSIYTISKLFVDQILLTSNVE